MLVRFDAANFLGKYLLFTLLCTVSTRPRPVHVSWSGDGSHTDFSLVKTYISSCMDDWTCWSKNGKSIQIRCIINGARFVGSGTGPMNSLFKSVCSPGQFQCCRLRSLLRVQWNSTQDQRQTQCPLERICRSWITH